MRAPMPNQLMLLLVAAIFPLAALSCRGPSTPVPPAAPSAQASVRTSFLVSARNVPASARPRALGVLAARYEALTGKLPTLELEPDGNIRVSLRGAVNKPALRLATRTVGRVRIRFLPQLNTLWAARPSDPRRGKPSEYLTIFDRASGRDIPQSALRSALSMPAMEFTNADFAPTSDWRSMDGKFYHVTFAVRESQRARFARAVSWNVGSPLAIFLDDRLISAPTVNAPIGPEGIIELKSFSTARLLSVCLNSGPLPGPLDISESAADLASPAR